MNSPLLSIIIPVYNVEPYIETCLDSVLSQTFTDFEVIMVNDGSTDNSGKICNRYADADKRFKVIHKPNGGVSSARNAALDICCGKYITMLDPDDSVAPDTYENVNFLESHPSVDILQFPYYNCYPDGKMERLELASRTIRGKDQLLLNWWSGSILHFANLNKIFRQKIFEGLRYRVGHLSEDTYLVADFIERADTAYISEKGKYFYSIRNNSLSSSYTFSKHIDLFEAHLRTYRKLTEYTLSKPVRVTAFTRLFRRLVSARMENPDKDIRPYLRQVKPLIPHWQDIAAAPTLWIITLKLLGVSHFMNLLCRHLKRKQNREKP